MSEEKMLDAVQAALVHRGIEDKLIAAGQFMPRGHTGGMFVGTLVGDAAGSAGGEIAEAAGAVAGGLAGARMADARSGLPAYMLVGVSETTVYGFAGRSRSKEPSDLAFQVPREGLTVKVHQRANVRVLELIDEASGSKIELEGNRLPITHSKDVIEALKG
jgi:uncharacterized protein YcfJ